MTRAVLMARRGFTMVEILLALSLAGLLALAVAMMLLAVGSATDEAIDTRQLVVHEQVAIVRLGDVLRSSVMILDESADALVVWRADDDGDGVPRLSEITRIEWDGADDVVRTYTTSVGIADPDDTIFTLADDFDAETAARAGTADYPGAVLAAGISAWAVALDDADAQAARLARVSITVEDDSGTIDAEVLAALRASAG